MVYFTEIFFTMTSLQIIIVYMQSEQHAVSMLRGLTGLLNEVDSISMLSVQHRKGCSLLPVMLLYLQCLHPPLNKSTEVSPTNTTPPDNSHSRGDIINCCSGDQCLWEEAREEGSGSHCSCSLYFGSLRQIPGCPYDGWQPFWSGRLVLGIMVDWELGAVRSEAAAVPSALQTGPLGAAALPRWKGGAINQPVWGAMLCPAIHLSPCSRMGKMGQEGLGGRGQKRFTYLGRGRRSCREEGQGSL